MCTDPGPRIQAILLSNEKNVLHPISTPFDSVYYSRVLQNMCKKMLKCSSNHNKKYLGCLKCAKFRAGIIVIYLLKFHTT